RAARWTPGRNGRLSAAVRSREREAAAGAIRREQIDRPADQGRRSEEQAAGRTGRGQQGGGRGGQARGRQDDDRELEGDGGGAQVAGERAAEQVRSPGGAEQGERDRGAGEWDDHGDQGAAGR